MAKKQRRSYTKEQKENAVRAYRACENYAQVARELDLHPSPLCQRSCSLPLSA